MRHFAPARLGNRTYHSECPRRNELRLNAFFPKLTFMVERSETQQIEFVRYTLVIGKSNRLLPLM